MSNWNISELQKIPDYKIVQDFGEIKAILFKNEPFHGKPTEVFAYIGIPEKADKPVPGMVCAHGGGGKAFKEWVELWLKRGYAAISMDFGGMGIDDKRLENAGPEQDHEAKFATDLEWKDLWTYHAIAAVLRSHTLLASFDEVDAEKTGVTGISWGGYLTCIAAGVDNRFKCAVPVYGCGFITDNSAEDWMSIFEKMTPEERKRWHDLCDPSIYIGNAEMPILFMTGTNDFAYPLDSLKKTYSLPKGSVNLCVRLEMPHGHIEGWTPKETGIFVDSILMGKTPLPKLGVMKIADGIASCKVNSKTNIAKAFLLHTCDSGKWQDRKWHQTNANINGNIISSKLPENAKVAFLALEDERGAYSSSPHEEI
jgi:dienelactone hydrolase